MNEFTIDNSNEKTVTMTHETSGKEVVIANISSVVSKYEALGYKA